MPESLMVIRSFSTLRKHWEWMTFSADSVSSVHTLTDDLPLESLADQPGAGNMEKLRPDYQLEAWTATVEQTVQFLKHHPVYFGAVGNRPCGC